MGREFRSWHYMLRRGGSKREKFVALWGMRAEALGGKDEAGWTTAETFK